MYLCQGLEAAVSFAFRMPFFIRSHRPSLEQMLKPQLCGECASFLSFCGSDYCVLEIILDFSFQAF